MYKILCLYTVDLLQILTFLADADRVEVRQRYFIVDRGGDVPLGPVSAARTQHEDVLPGLIRRTITVNNNMTVHLANAPVFGRDRRHGKLVPSLSRRVPYESQEQTKAAVIQTKAAHDTETL